MTKDEAGRWRCPDDRKGADETELSRENAAGAMENPTHQQREEGGRMLSHNISAAGVIDTSVFVQRTTLDDI